MGNSKKSERSGLGGWIAQWGFSILVGLAALVGAYVAWKVSVPEQVPDFALKAAPVYRIEVGAAAFLALYLALEGSTEESIRDLKTRLENVEKSQSTERSTG